MRSKYKLFLTAVALVCFLGLSAPVMAEDPPSGDQGSKQEGEGKGKKGDVGSAEGDTQGQEGVATTQATNDCGSEPQWDEDGGEEFDDHLDIWLEWLRCMFPPPPPTDDGGTTIEPVDDEEETTIDTTDDCDHYGRCLTDTYVVCMRGWTWDSRMSERERENWYIRYWDCRERAARYCDRYLPPKKKEDRPQLQRPKNRS